MTRISLVIFLAGVLFRSMRTDSPTDVSDLNSSTIPPELLTTPSVLNPTNFFAYLEEDRTKELYAELVSRLSNYTILLDQKFSDDLDEEVKKQRTNWEKEMLPLRLCCEPQYLRYHITQAKQRSGVKMANVLFFEETHRKEWIDKILKSKDEDDFAGQLRQALASNKLDVEDFVNQSQIIDMRASVAIHTYLSRTVRPLTPMVKWEKQKVDRFTLSTTHEKLFNVLADAMNITKISLGEFQEVLVDICEEIVDLRNKKS